MHRDKGTGHSSKEVDGGGGSKLRQKCLLMRADSWEDSVLSSVRKSKPARGWKYMVHKINDSVTDHITIKRATIKRITTNVYCDKTYM